MVDKIKTIELLKRTKVLTRSAFICYLIPFSFFGVSILDHYLLHSTQQLFWRMFLLSMFPFGLLGLLFAIIGIIQSMSIKSYKKKTTGYYHLFLGIIIVAAGILGWMLLYLTVS